MIWSVPIWLKKLLGKMYILYILKKESGINYLQKLLDDPPALNDQEEKRSWLARLGETVTGDFKELFAPERLGKLITPTAIVGIFTGIGALLTGGNPLGAGVGLMGGKWLVGKLDAGQTTEKLSELIGKMDAQGNEGE